MTRALALCAAGLAAGVASGAAAILWLSAGALPRADVDAGASAADAGASAAAAAALSGVPQDEEIERALEQLAAIAEPAEALRFALEFLATVGYKTEAIDRLANAQAPVPGRALRAAALERKARLDPDEAVRAALALAEPLRAATLRRVAAAWAGAEPRAAVAAVDRLPAELRDGFLREVFAAWSRTAPLELLEHLETTTMTPTVVDNTLALRDFLARYPEEARRIAARLPPTYAQALAQMP